MTRRISPVVGMLLMVAGPVQAQDRSRPFSVVVPALPSAGRLMAFALTIKGGQVSAFRTVPAGWVITVDNDPSWNGSVTGRAVVGAAALDQSDLSAMFTISPPPSAVAGAPLSVSGSVTVMVNGEEISQAFSSIPIMPAAAQR